MWIPAPLPLCWRLGTPGSRRPRSTLLGGIQNCGNASLQPCPGHGARGPRRPAAGLPLPITSGLTSYGTEILNGNSSATIQPGIYKQITVSGYAELTLSSGIYIIEGGGFSVSGNANVSGSGVTIFNAGSKYPITGGTYGNINLAETAHAT